MIGVFSVDPGGTSGIGWGVFDPSLPFEEMLAKRTRHGSAEIRGEYNNQVRATCTLYNQFVTNIPLSPGDIWFICEDFVPYGGGVGGKEGISPAFLIGGIEGYRMGQYDALKRRGEKPLPPLILQTAGQAKGYATNARLKEWDIWVVGSDHKRSAWQHIAYFLKRYQLQHRV